MPAYEKDMLRQKILAERKTLCAQEVKEKSRLIAEHVACLPEFQHATTLLMYLPFKNEVETWSLMGSAWQDNKRVAVPICQPNHTLQISVLQQIEELAPGHWGIPEPQAQFIRPLPPTEIDLALLPGVAFDLQGHRLGYGAGYFDRFLKLLRPNCTVAALAYAFQVLPIVPSEAHDWSMDLIITENKIYNLRTPQ